MTSRGLVLLLGLSFAAACFSDPPPAGSSGGSTASGSSGGDSTTSNGSEGATTGDPGSTSSGDPLPTTAGESSSSTGTPDPTGPDPTGDPKPMCPPGGPLLYLALDGVTLQDSGIGIDNAPAATVADPNLARDYGPYVNRDRPLLVERVRSHFAPFGVCVVDQQPAAPDYDMVVVTSDTFDNNPNVIGFLSTDCENSESNNVTAVFLSGEIEIGTDRRALVVSKYAASLYGLEQLGAVDAPMEIMNRFVSETNNGATFTDTCYPVDGQMCNPGACADGLQNSVDRLTAAFD